ncbi:MAG TPA: HEAT repeat domain-containing protein [Pyrinomonadaceae bacterium]|jgi:HEAT repeat protein|nr:HEAT repeat domain-containing protein [Pyrinomonadaceae bacterium]
MNKDWSRHNFAAPAVAARIPGSNLSNCIRLTLTTMLGTTLVLCPPNSTPQARQQNFRESEVKVTGVASSGNTISISADGSLNRAQTWQDPEGFHVVLVNGQTSIGGSPRGVKVRRVGNSLELLVPVKPGANVTVQPRGNRLDLVVSGGTAASVEPVESRSTASEVSSSAPERSPAVRASQTSTVERLLAGVPRRRNDADALTGETNPTGKKVPSVPSEQAAAAGAAPGAGQQPGVLPVAAAGAGDNPPAPTDTTAAVEAGNATPPPAQTPVEMVSEAESSVFSLTTLLLLLGSSLLGGALFVLRRRRGASEGEGAEAKAGATSVAAKGLEVDDAEPEFVPHKGDRRKTSVGVMIERRRDGRGAEDEATRRQIAIGEEGRAPSPALPSVIFGAYRIDQEISRLVLGESHSVEVLSSRAQDDRRAIETSLMKAMRSPELDEDGRRRARMALEDYGFVARQSATLLFASDTYERVSSARTLGDVRSSQALPFLTEALYDNDPVVRTEAVQSLGALGLPSAIGALLDIARRHPEIPSSILGPALTACSVESLELSWGASTDSRTFAGAGAGGEFTGEIWGLEPVAIVEELPEWLEDVALVEALDRLESADAEGRIASAQILSQFQVRRAVEALAVMTVRDESPLVRAAAVTSLGAIDHESVFAPVLVAMADDAREVRAAAARSLSRLSFERADAYARVIETTDEEMLRDVARACVKAGLASQAIDRLASEDRRQAYEAFSLLSLAVKAGETGLVLDAVQNHRDTSVRLAAVRLLGLTARREVLEQLHLVAGQGHVPEQIRAAILEVVQRAGETEPAELI